MNSTTLSTVPDLVLCIHPISGIYTQFQRLWFWVVIIVVLFFQFHQWLIAGSIALVATFSFTASLHAVILGVQNSSASDGDLLALQVILQSSILASLLCAIFCPRVFEHKVNKVWILWCLLVIVAREVQSSLAAAIILTLPDDTVPVHCSQQGVCENPCKDMRKQTTFREPSDLLQPVIWSTHMIPMNVNGTKLPDWIAESRTVLDAGYPLLRETWWSYFFLGPLLQFVMIYTSWTPREARNLLFHRLRRGYVPKNRDQPKGKLICIEILINLRYCLRFLVACSVEVRILDILIRFLLWMVQKAIGKRKKVSFNDLAVLKVREARFYYWYAKMVAVLWYLWSEVSYLAILGGVAYFTFKAENSISWVPESESKRTVGQWSTWTAFGFGVVAAMISRLKSEKSNVNKRSIYLDDHRLDNPEADENARMARALREQEWRLHTHLAAQFVFKWLDFKYWWLHTVEASAETRREMDLKSYREKKQREMDLKEYGKMQQKENLKDELDIWATITLSGEAVSKNVYLVPPSSRAVEDYSYLEDEELQIVLQEEADGKARTEETSWWQKAIHSTHLTKTD